MIRNLQRAGVRDVLEGATPHQVGCVQFLRMESRSGPRCSWCSRRIRPERPEAAPCIAKPLLLHKHRGHHRQARAGASTQESCTQYNMLKIARRMFAWTGSPGTGVGWGSGGVCRVALPCSGLAMCVSTALQEASMLPSPLQLHSPAFVAAGHGCRAGHDHARCLFLLAEVADYYEKAMLNGVIGIQRKPHAHDGNGHGPHHEHRHGHHMHHHESHDSGAAGGELRARDQAAGNHQPGTSVVEHEEIAKLMHAAYEAQPRPANAQVGLVECLPWTVVGCAFGWVDAWGSGPGLLGRRPCQHPPHQRDTGPGG